MLTINDHKNSQYLANVMQSLLVSSTGRYTQTGIHVYTVLHGNYNGIFRNWFEVFRITCSQESTTRLQMYISVPEYMNENIYPNSIYYCTFSISHTQHFNYTSHNTFIPRPIFLWKEKRKIGLGTRLTIQQMYSNMMKVYLLAAENCQRAKPL